MYERVVESGVVNDMHAHMRCDESGVVNDMHAHMRCDESVLRAQRASERH